MKPRHGLALLLALFLLGNGFVSGQDGKKKTRPKNPAFAKVGDDPALPRVLLIGDSISIGYTLEVRRLLDGKANVHRIPTNGGPTIRGTASIDSWLGDGKWDVIHFNWGLHDIKITKGKHQVPSDQYSKNMESLVERMKKTGATLIWASTTPVPEGKLSPLRKPGDEVAYNEVAAKIMKEHGVATNDLYALVKKSPKDIQRKANVHFTQAGSKVLAKQVAAKILEALKK